MASIALAGCNAATAPARAPARTSAPLRFIVAADVPTLNGAINDSPVPGLIDEFVMSYLLRADPRGHLVPDLALQVPSLANGGLSRDGKTVVYHLRHGVRWHDGPAFTSADVAFSFAFVNDPNANVPDRGEYDNIASVETPDAYTVRVHLREPSASAVGTFFAGSANDPYPVLPAHVSELKTNPNHANFNSAPIGTGPYEFVRWRRGDRVSLEANPKYYAGKPPIAKIDFITIPASSSFSLALQSGDADVATVLDELGESDANPLLFTTTSGPIESSQFLLFNVARGPLRDARLRRAIVESIDVERLASETLSPGAGRFTATDRLPGAEGYDPALKHPPFDLAAAARELDAAGYPLRNGIRTLPGGATLSIEIGTTSRTSQVRLATLVQAQLRAAGFNASIHSYPYAIFYNTYADGGMMARGRFDLAVTGWAYNGIADHSYLYACDSRPPNGENYSGICDPVIERARRLARTDIDPRVQSQADAAISRRIVERSYLDMLWFTSLRVVVRKGLIGPVPTVLNQPGWNAPVWHWDASAGG